MFTEQARSYCLQSFEESGVVDRYDGETMNRNKCFWEGHLKMDEEVTG